MRALTIVPGVVILVALSAGPGFPGDHPKVAGRTFEELLALAKRDMSTKEGAAYDTRMGKQFVKKHTKSVVACAEAVGGEVPEAFQVVVVVAKDGKVSTLSLSRETEVTKCIANLLLHEVFPKPPIAPFHDLMEMSFE
jgi:hypothetical protein